MAFVLTGVAARPRQLFPFLGRYLKRIVAKSGILLAAMLPCTLMAGAYAHGTRVIRINCARAGSPFISPLNVCIGGEHAALEFTPESLHQLAIAHHRCGIEYIRFHGILAPDMHVVKKGPHSQPVFHWRKVEKLYSDILATGCKPLVELSFMPRALASGKATCFFYRGNITPPRHYGHWGRMIKSMVHALEARFGRRQVRSWYFEVWNEPNYSGFSTVGFPGYMKLYAATARAIKAVDPKLRVGGPATAGMGWISRFIAACHRQHLPLDFISCHTYGCGQHRWPNGKSGLRVSGSPTAIAGGLHWTQQRIRRSAMPHLPLLITEWGPSYSSRDPVHDSYFQAVWLLQQVHAIKHPPLMMSYWALSDIFDEDGPQTMPFEGGFGIFNPEGIRKPSFVALAFLHRVQGRRLHTHDPESVAAISHRSLRILAWDYRWPTQTSSDSSYFSVPHPSVVARSIHLHVSHLHPGRYVVRIYREGYRHEDAYTLYQKWGRPQRLTAHQLAQLRRVTADRPVEKFMITVGPNGSWRRTLSLRSNGIALISIKPEGR